MAAHAPHERRAVAVRNAAGRVLLFVVVLAALWGLWEAYRWLWIREAWTWPFVVNDTTMPHLSDIFAALWGSASPGGVGPRLLTVLVKGALFTAKEAAVGFAIGALVGFALGVVLAHFRLLQRGFLPWVVATASVVGAIIGELPSSIPNGLGAQILNFSQYYTTEPRGLWATNVIAAALGISFFLVIVIAEKLVVRRAPENLV